MAEMTCEELRPLLVDYVVGELTPPVDQQECIDKHLSECENCRGIAEELRGTGRALEAVKSFDTKLREEVRNSITSRARVEAQLVRATREHQKIAGETAGKPVPAAAWLVLAIGTIGALALAVIVPTFGVFSPKPAGKVLSCVGEELRQSLPKGEILDPGRALSVPAKCILCVRLTDGGRLDVAGPAELRMAGKSESLVLTRGKAYIVSAVATRVKLSPLQDLELAAGSKVCLQANPVDEVAALVTVVSGSASYTAKQGDGRIDSGKTLEVNGRSSTAKLRPMKETERAHWRKQLEVVQ